MMVPKRITRRRFSRISCFQCHFYADIPLSQLNSPIASSFQFELKKFSKNKNEFHESTCCKNILCLKKCSSILRIFIFIFCQLKYILRPAAKTEFPSSNIHQTKIVQMPAYINWLQNVCNQ